MRISELSSTTGIPVATIKYYIREQLLPAGERTHPNQSSYSDDHVRRVRLIRALMEVGGLSLTAVRGVLATLDIPGESVHHVLGLAQHAMAPPSTPPVTIEFRAARAQVDEVLGRLGWHVSPNSSGRDAAAAVLTTLSALHQERLTRVLEPYARAAEMAARADLDAVAAVGVTGDRDAMVETAVIGMVVGEPLMLHLRRLAQEHVSAQRLSRPSRPAMVGSVDPGPASNPVIA